MGFRGDFCFNRTITVPVAAAPAVTTTGTAFAVSSPSLAACPGIRMHVSLLG